MKYLLIGTPKAIARLNRDEAETKLRERFPGAEFEVMICMDVYWNMLDDWSEEDCDNVIYCVPKD